MVSFNFRRQGNVKVIFLKPVTTNGAHAG